jgi:RNA polymerase sigma-70 factor, ECF subfamily
MEVPKVTRLYPSGTDLTDRQLIQDCIDRRDGAWEIFLEKYSALVYHVIWKALRSEAQHIGASTVEVEDVAADVYAQVVANNFKLLRTFRWQCKFSTWLGIITYRTTRQAIYRNRHVAFSIDNYNSSSGNELLLRDIIPDPNPLPPEDVLAEEARRLVHEALATLPPRDQLVLKFFYFEGKKYAEIARILGISGSLVGTAIFRAKARLAEKLERSHLSERKPR